MMFCSCTFDKMFLLPTKLDKETKEVSVVLHQTGEDVTIKFDEFYSPVFYDKNNEELDFGVDFSSVFFENSIGNNLHAWYVEPKIEYNGFTILFLHGNAGNLTSHFQIITPLVQKGFRVFLFDYSGFGFSEGKSTRKNVLIDAQSALEYLQRDLNVKSSELVIYGQSLGGNLAAKLAADNQNKFSALVIEGAFTSHSDIAAYVTKLGFIARGLVKELYSSKVYVRENHRPVLVIHSVDDEIIPFFMGKQIYNNANNPKEFMKIRKRHICGPLYYPDKITEKILNICQ